MKFGTNQLYLDILFSPAKRFPDNIGIASVSMGTNVKPDELVKGATTSKSGKNLLLYVLGCIDYGFPTDPDAHHQTGFILSLSKTDPRISISVDDGLIPADKLILLDSGLGMGRFAD